MAANPLESRLFQLGVGMLRLLTVVGILAGIGNFIINLCVTYKICLYQPPIDPLKPPTATVTTNPIPSYHSETPRFIRLPKPLMATPTLSPIPSYHSKTPRLIRAQVKTPRFIKARSRQASASSSLPID